MANFFKPVVKSQKINEQLTVHIDKLDINGVGVARWQGKPIFIAGALPNEVAEVKVIEQKSKYARAKIIAINKQNEHRVTPKCQHFGQCGGCDLQMLALSAQLTFKQQKVTELFVRSLTAEDGIVKKRPNAKLTTQKTAIKTKKIDLPWQAPIQSEPWHYRRKARIGVQFDKNDLPIIGFRQKSTNQLTVIKSCPVLVEPVNNIFPILKQLLAQLTVKAAIGHIEVIHADITHVELENNTAPSVSQDDNSLVGESIVLVVRQLKVMNAIDTQLWQQFAKKHAWHVIIDNGAEQQALEHSKQNVAPKLSYTLDDGNQIYFASSDFIQINYQVNNAMISQALAWMNLGENDKVLDLFCGLGNFSLAIAKKSKQVVGVEGVQVMVDKAIHNAQVNGLNNCQFYQADLNSEWLTASWATAQVFDKVLLDPARAGAEQAVKQIATLKIPSVLYVSCDPATLARDSAILVAQGYKIEKISLMDMFSQTKHVETMVLFTQ
ncbi:23S rRNA (uracil(1939)-C(5))-methyltransferase RlmD [Colwellia echini]|uniref:23S rRNA (uracil(1939)-C(5))-methyltransferase RlmD n=1 Tax=Colwellia echini TaxID=1982103 RepID=A0ABY3MV50_9GAMM|nr:23S rRNA (uracil(1939)-C(5))-methyltransferase RlmD [Colwellia echini]TYK65069.1 23S rRNA (uracil(1939)-C(5))-methyltransferase RlmD [Colwellia echini]